MQSSDSGMAVLALGGNALLRRGEDPRDIACQQRNAVAAARSAKRLVDAGYRLIVTHGNGPQVGLLALQASYDSLP